LGVVFFVENDIKFPGKLHRNLDLSYLTKGIYLLKVEGKGISSTINVVIGK